MQGVAVGSDESRTITHSTKVVRRHGDGNVGSTPTAVREQATATNHSGEVTEMVAGGSGRNHE